MSRVRLRASLIWLDEVMGDVVLESPGPVTLGDTPTATFVMPDIGLPQNFAIIRPGNRGFLLTLSDRMQGTIFVDGKEHDVSEFVRRGGEAEHGFSATAISGRDWGVVELDASGKYKLFFQFVPVDPPLPVSLFGPLGLLQPAFAFSTLLHVAFVLMSMTLRIDDDPTVWPGPRELTGDYLVERIEAPPEPPPQPVAGEKSAAAAAPADGDKEKLKSATKNPEGKSGGEGETRAKDPDAGEEVPNPPKVAFFEDKNRKHLDAIFESNAATDLNKFLAIKGERTPGRLGAGKGTGTGVGDDLMGSGTTRGSAKGGTGGGGSASKDFVSQGAIDVGEKGSPKGSGGRGSAPKEIKVGFAGGAAGDFGGLTKEEIDKVVRAKQGLLRACYQKELNRQPGLGGKLVINFVIANDGSVKSTRTDPGKSSLRHDGVESCVRTQITKLRFPAGKGGGVVNYPFIFNQS